MGDLPFRYSFGHSSSYLFTRKLHICFSLFVINYICNADIEINLRSCFEDFQGEILIFLDLMTLISSISYVFNLRFMWGISYESQESVEHKNGIESDIWMKIVSIIDKNTKKFRFFCHNWKSFHSKITFYYSFELYWSLAFI